MSESNGMYRRERVGIMKLHAIAAASAALLAAAPAAAQVVNVDGRANASLDGSNGVVINLAAGAYQITFTQDAFTAFTRFDNVSGCDSNGRNCRTGFENSARYQIGGTTFLFGDGAGSGGIGPVSGGAYYDSAAASFAAAGKYGQRFTLGSAQSVNFFLYDDFLGDNSGGVSLALTAVPEPSTWAMLILGMGVVGGALRRRKTLAVRFA